MLESVGHDAPEPMSLASLHALARVSLYAALVGAGAYILIPLGPLHISLQPFMVMLAGFNLGARRGALALSVYVAAGLLGLPVFGQGKAGPASLLGPTAGFFLGFIAGAAIAGLASGRRLSVMLVCGALGSTVVLLVGTAVLRYRFFGEWDRALIAGFYPFIIGDLIKMFAAALVSRAFFSVGDRGTAHA